MGKLLGHGPVKMFEIAGAHPQPFALTFSLNMHLKIDVESMPIFFAQVFQRRGFLHRSFFAERRKRAHGDHPGGNAGRKVFGVEGTQWLVFPFLNITGRPVINQDHAEDVVIGFINGNRITLTG